MKIKIYSSSFVTAVLMLGLAPVLSPSAARAAEAVKTVTIIANDNLKFSILRIDATPGQTLHVELRNQGTLPKEGMGHNWILLDSDAQANTYAMAAMSARNVGYEPKALASHVLASIPLLGPKETGEVTFQAPTKPGKYPFICSCSGHSMAGMRGELIVK